MRPIPSMLHGILDYAAALLLIIVPFLFMTGGDAGEATAATGEPFAADAQVAAWLLIGAGIAVLGLNLLTRYELGAIKVIPMRAHIVIDIVAGLFLIASPWLFGFADLIWWPHVLVGATVVVLAALTRPVTSLDDERSDALATHSRV